MKRTLVATLVLLLLLSSCAPKQPSVQTEGDGWQIYTEEFEEGFSVAENRDSICRMHTNVGCNFWAREEGDDIVVLLGCLRFAVGRYYDTSDLVCYVVTGDDMDDVLSGLAQWGEFSSMLDTDPYIFTETTVMSDNEDSDSDGWVTRVVDGVEYDWPVNASSNSTGWMTDDAEFQITGYTELEDATDDLESIKSSVELAGYENFKLWYLEDYPYQGMMWLLDGEYYISIAQYDETGSIYLTLSAQSDTNLAREYAERYGLLDGLLALTSSDPIFET